jgi:NAD(P)H-hydrate epimerase
MLILSRDDVRRIDKLAIEKLGIPGVVLMENAGRSTAEIVLSTLNVELRLAPEASSVAVLCGGGNNGGDGYVIARHLCNAGVNVRIYSAADQAKLSGDAAINSTIASKMKIPACDVRTPEQLAAATPDLERANIFADALLGTGFHGDVRPDLASVIQLCNRLAPAGGPRKVIAVDVPSGLDCDTGQPSNATIRADTTVTFVAMKRGFLNDAAKAWMGRVTVAGIGAPAELLVSMLQDKS